MKFTKAFSFIFLLLTLTGYTQQAKLDSLEKLLPTLKGKEKVFMLGELCYQYSYVNSQKAIKFGQAGIEIAKKLNDSLILAQAWNDLSIAYLYRGDYDSTLLLNQMALKIRQQYGDSLLVGKSLAKIASAYYELGNMDASLTTNLRALKIFEEAEQPALIGQLLNNIGNVYDRNGNSQQAIKTFKKAAESANKFGNQAAYATAMGNLANVYHDVGELEKSEKIYLELIPIVKKQGSLEHLSSIYQGLGVNYRRRSQHDKGIEYYHKALDIYEQIGSKPGVSLISVNLGNAYLDISQPDKAEPYLQKGLQLSKESKSYYQLKHAYLGLARLETRKENFEKADAYFDYYVDYMDSIYSEESNELISEMQVKYETEKKEKELAESKAILLKEQLKLKQRNTQLALAGGGVLLLFALGFMLVRQQRLKRQQLKREAELKVQNERVRISRDLHDNIGAELTIISSTLDKKAYQTKQESEKKELEDISDNARNAMTQLRETIWAIGNDEVEVEVFAAKVREYGMKICNPSNIKFQLILDETIDKTFSPAETINLYRICQEAINNAVKYSGSERILVEIKATGNSLILTISDQGKGFDIANAKTGYGLQNMKQRTEEINATLITTSTKSGTTIQVAGV